MFVCLFLSGGVPWVSFHPLSYSVTKDALKRPDIRLITLLLMSNLSLLLTPFISYPPLPPLQLTKIICTPFCFHWQNSGLVVITDYELPGGFDDRMIMMAGMPDMESGV